MINRMTIRYCAVLCFALGSILRAQAPPPQGTPATQLPLSGRGGQGGSVNTVQTPVPGVTSSVNTLNTSVQVQGPYAGSVAGNAKPFSGKLSLREAVEQENLAALGLRFNFHFPGISIPTIVGPFNYYDLRATRACPRACRMACVSPSVPRLYSSARPTASRNDSLPEKGFAAPDTLPA